MGHIKCIANDNYIFCIGFLDKPINKPFPMKTSFALMTGGIHPKFMLIKMQGQLFTQKGFYLPN